MKKFLSIFLALMFVLTAISLPSYAEDEEDRLLTLVKSRIGSTDEYNDFSSSFYDWDGERDYYFSWTVKGDNYKELNVTVIPEGIITSYGIYNNYSSDEKIRKGTYDAALQRAKELFFKINPSLEGKYVISRRTDYEPISEYEYSFGLSRVENGINVASDTGYLDISSDMTKINDFYLTYTPSAELKKPENVISEDAAKEYFSKNIGMTLSYRIKFNKDRQKEAYLVYIPAKNNTYIDAFTGEAKHIQDDFYYNNSKAEARYDMAGKGSEESFSEAEQEELTNLKSVISKENAEKLVRKNKLLRITNDYELDWSGLYKEYGNKDKYMYELSFSNKTTDGYASVIINAVTGELIRFYNYDEKYEEDEKKYLSPEKRYELAVKYAKEIAAQRADEYIFEADEYVKYGSYVFNRKVGSLPCIDDCITVNVGQTEGNLTEYSISYSEIDFPDASGCMSEEEALNLLYQKRGMDLLYIPSYKEGDKERLYNLVYTPDIRKAWTIDASSGEIDDDNFEIPEYTDISGHYGEAAVKDLKKYNIGCSTTEFMPDKPITQKEFINLITNIIKWNNSVIFDDTDNLQAYEYQDILKNGETISDRSISRIEAAVYIIRALGIEEYASLNDIYISPFSDVPKDKTGCTALLYGMKMIKGNGTYYNPDGTLTRADAAIIIDNYINR